MKIIEQSYEILSKPIKPLEMLEMAGRTCYKSEDKITTTSAKKFVTMLRDNGHHAMIEFGDIIVKFITNRGVANEIVRHRLCSFAQESTRYVNYNNGNMVFIKPVWWNKSKSEAKEQWVKAMKTCEICYNTAIQYGWRKEQAREILPNSLKTEIVVKANIREFMHILNLRCSQRAHPQMRGLMLPLLKELHQSIPIVFDLLYEKYIIKTNI